MCMYVYYLPQELSLCTLGMHSNLKCNVTSENYLNVFTYKKLILLYI